jgi:ribosome-binding factor A
MPREFSRTQRLGEQLRREISQLIRDEIKDPRVGMVTITDVVVSRDLGNAKVFFTTLMDEHKDESMKVLNKAAGFLRGELGRRLSIRMIPQLHFSIDESIATGAHMSSLIDAAISSDRKKSTEDKDDDDSGDTETS